MPLAASIPPHRRTDKARAGGSSGAKLSQEAALFSTQMHHSVQMLACGAHNAGASLLHNVMLVLQKLQQQGQKSNSAGAETASAAGSASDEPGGSQYAWDAVSQAVVAGCCDVISVLIAHDSSCQEEVQNSLGRADSVNKVRLSSQADVTALCAVPACCLA